MKKYSRYNFFDDLTTLEKIYLLLVGIASHIIKSQIQNDVHTNNQIIPPNNLKSQIYLDEIQNWTQKQKMELNEEKTKCMVFNFTKKKQFSTRLTLNGKNIDTVKKMKLLGTMIINDLKWNKNTRYLIKRAYGRIELLRKMSEVTKSKEYRIHIYKTYQCGTNIWIFEYIQIYFDEYIHSPRYLLIFSWRIYSYIHW